MPMREINSRNWITIKGLLFLVLGLLSSMLLILQYPTWKTTVLLFLAIWSFCRFYYFCFYVIEHYVDSTYRFSGLVSLIRRLLNKPKPRG